MGPKALRATSRKAAIELPETSRANFLTSAAQLVSTSLPQLSTHLGQQALKVLPPLHSSVSWTHFTQSSCFVKPPL